ncbi:FkbM family methyltransferase [Leptothoe sp. PORK10 BA2]|uniref:FkbM family methyltransferase n=1 Tax=Leptothoe sp. PORK10 BA2 TaxID=3110254 RepID=UPI002B20DE98|nr:FkbM family methyltransferase [Leptothoe sp. PORK10 BA2]MEA5466505.1 FkbM family methyltransferase [Leptothoe sp. PORK10 BA2]
MSIVSNLARKFQSLAIIVDNPSLLKLRKKGGYPSIFCELDKPWIHDLGIKSVLDIGANRGQFSMTINALWPSAVIYAFEPIPDCYQALQACLPGHQPFNCFNIGLGEAKSSLVFEVNDFSPASSFLEMSDTQTKTFPKTENTQSIEVQVERLDDIVSTLQIEDPIFIKIDVQGYEDRVLVGGEETVRQAKLIMVETSFKEMYKGQMLFDGLYRWLTDRGFTYVGAIGQLESPETGEIIQSDALFLRTN